MKTSRGFDINAPIKFTAILEHLKFLIPVPGNKPKTEIEELKTDIEALKHSDGDDENRFLV